MADQEDCRRVTRLASKKRQAEEAMQNPKRKGRVVLGEIPNVANQEQRIQTKKKGDKGKSILNVDKRVKEKETGVDLNEESDESQICKAINSDINRYLRNMEMDPKRRPLPDYLEKIQKDLTPHMRGILIDWLVEVIDEYKLQSDTLFITVSYVDRFLSNNVLSRNQLQLLGVSSMLIASKYEEIKPPHVEDFVYITDNSYTRDEVMTMEVAVLKSLGYELGSPTLKTFLRRFTRVAQKDFESSSLQFEFLGCYLAELSLLDYEFVKFLPSLVAASVMFQTRFTLQPRQQPWNSALQLHSEYKASDLKECVTILHELQLSRRGGSLVAVRDKYKHHKFKCVSTLSPPPEIPESYFGG